MLGLPLRCVQSLLQDCKDAEARRGAFSKLLARFGYKAPRSPSPSPPPSEDEVEAAKPKPKPKKPEAPPKPKKKELPKPPPQKPKVHACAEAHACMHAARFATMCCHVAHLH